MVSNPGRVLISTIRPAGGGVPVVLKFVIDCLRQREYKITLAYYQPYSVTPEHSVPLLKLFSQVPTTVEGEFYDTNCVGVGCWLPELEFTHYWETRQWNKLIEEHDYNLVISGSCLAALFLVQRQKPFMAWVASDWQGDREHRARSFPFFRRTLDRLVVTPVTKRLERKIIRSHRLVAVSETSQQRLNDAVKQEAVTEVLTIPIDTRRFMPASKSRTNPTIGFVGRFEDPRKHIELLFDVLAALSTTIEDIELILVGDQLSHKSRMQISELGLEQKVTVIPYAKDKDLPGILSEVDVFVLPSHQEGLCIAALEAMSCGVPVVSTRCGGPENYIVDGENGRLCDHEASSISDAVLQLLADSRKRKYYAERARGTIIDKYSIATQSARFLRLFDKYCLDRV